MTLGNYGAPPDPAYRPFLDGLKEIAPNTGAKIDRFWHSGDSKWNDYPVSAWVLEDPRIAPTTDSDAFGDGVWDIEKKAWKMRISEFEVPRLFQAVQQAYKTAHTADPKATIVWHPVGGYWRKVTQRTSTGPGPKPLPPEALKRMDAVDAMVRDGVFDHATGEARKLEIAAEYDRMPDSPPK